MFPENLEGGILERSISAPQSGSQLAATVAGASAAAGYVKRASVAVADAVSDFVLADFDVRYSVVLHLALRIQGPNFTLNPKP